MGRDIAKIMMVGLGSVGQRHVRNLRHLMAENVEIMAYRTRKRPYVITEQSSIEPSSNLEEQYHIYSYDDFDLAMDQNPDAVFICNPPDRHMPIALAVAKRGIPLFIEKPLSHNWEHVSELIELVESRDIIAFVGYQMRFHPCLQSLSALIARKAIGKILAIRVELGEYLPGFHPYEDYRNMHESHQERGGGVILSQIHEFDYIYWLFGLPRRVFALGGHVSRLEIDAEDIASILMEYNIEGKSIPLHLQLDFMQRPPSRTCQIIGDGGKILMDLRKSTVTVFDNQGCLAETISYEGFQRNQLFLDEMKHFLECLQNKENPRVTVREGAQSLRMALAARESLSAGRVLDLGETG